MACRRLRILIHVDGYPPRHRACGPVSDGANLLRAREPSTLPLGPRRTPQHMDPGRLFQFRR